MTDKREEVRAIVEQVSMPDFTSSTDIDKATDAIMSLFAPGETQDPLVVTDDAAHSDPGRGEVWPH